MRILTVLMREVERAQLLLALFDSKGNKSDAARSLGIHREGLYRRLRRFDLHGREFPRGGDLSFSLGVEVQLARALMMEVARYRADRLTLPFQLPADPRIEALPGQTLPLKAVPENGASLSQ